MAAGAARPLSDAEQRTLAELQARAGVTPSRRATPRAGSLWVALTNLSHPRPNDPEHKTDLITTGNTFMATDADVAHYIGACGCRDHQSRQAVPMVRRATEPSELLGALKPRQLAGPVRRPAQPGPGDEGPRPDPKGSSRLMVYERIPEESEPQAGTENSGTEGPDALDLPPGTRIQA